MVKVQMFQPPQMSGDLGNTSLLFTFHYSGWLTGTLGVVCYNQSYKAAKKTYILYIAQPYRQIRMVWTFITKWEENKQTRHNTFAFIPRAFGDLVWCDLGVLVSRNCVKKCPKYSFPSGESQNPEPLPNPMKLLIVPTWSTKRQHYMSVNQNDGTPKWKVYNGKPYSRMILQGLSFIFGSYQGVSMWFLPSAHTES